MDISMKRKFIKIEEDLCNDYCEILTNIGIGVCAFLAVSYVVYLTTEGIVAFKGYVSPKKERKER